MQIFRNVINCNKVRFYEVPPAWQDNSEPHNILTYLSISLLFTLYSFIHSFILYDLSRRLYGKKLFYRFYLQFNLCHIVQLYPTHLHMCVLVSYDISKYTRTRTVQYSTLQYSTALIHFFTIFSILPFKILFVSLSLSKLL